MMNSAEQNSRKILLNGVKRGNFFIPFPFTFSLRTGFTLAEVLITLGIIGVVAAMTIHTLMANYQKTQYVTGLKKFYTNWSSSLSEMATDAGTPGDLSSFQTSANDTTIGNNVAAYFKVIKNCQLTAATGCFSHDKASNIDGSGRSIGLGLDDPSSGGYRFRTLDGMSYWILSSMGGAQNCNTAFGASEPTAHSCFLMAVDTNGDSMPNTEGRDIFWFFVTQKAPFLYPRGGALYNPWQTNGCNDGYNSMTNKVGLNCAGRVMEEGWQMKY